MTRSHILNQWACSNTVNCFPCLLNNQRNHYSEEKDVLYIERASEALLPKFISAQDSVHFCSRHCSLSHFCLRWSCQRTSYPKKICQAQARKRLPSHSSAQLLLALPQAEQPTSQSSKRPVETPLPLISNSHSGALHSHAPNASSYRPGSC